MKHSPESYPSAGYFRCGLPCNRSGKGSRPLIIFQGSLFENKPHAGMTFGYGFLEKDYTLYALLRKLGLPQGYTLKDMADDYAELIGEEFAGAVDVIGVSTGGSIAQHFAADHPELVCHLFIHSSAHTQASPPGNCSSKSVAWRSRGRLCKRLRPWLALSCLAAVSGNMLPDHRSGWQRGGCPWAHPRD